MQSLTYNNINSDFSLNNISSLLTKFWINEVLNKRNYSKIWLTIIIFNKNNQSYTLIHNLPFNISSYTDVIIVLKQIFNANHISNKDIIDNIVFKFHFDKDNYNKDLFITNLFLYISIVFIIIVIIFCTFIIYLEFNQILFNDNISQEVINFANDCLKDSSRVEYNKISKPFMFNPFIELFNGNNYFPGKFIDTNLNDFYALKYINNQDIIADDNVTSLMKTIIRLNSRIEEYESLVDDLIPLIKLAPKP